MNEQKSYQFCIDRSISHIFSPDCTALIQLRQNTWQNIEKCVVHVLPKLYEVVSARRGDMTARMIIAKLVAFLFVQILSVRIQNSRNVQVLLLGTA